MSRCKHPKENRLDNLGSPLIEHCTLCRAERRQRASTGAKPWVWGPWQSPGTRVRAALLARNLGPRTTL